MIALVLQPIAIATAIALSKLARDSTRGGYVINVARGGHFDETALAEALDDGRVAVAALDVRVTEPPDPVADPLRGRPDVVLTPHVAGTSREAVDDLHRLAAEYVLDLLETGGRIPAAA